MKTFCQFIIGLFFLPSYLPAQKNNALIKYLHTESFTVDQGLSQGMVNCITQDQFGFMWFGTMDGLNRYDGYKVSVFRHNPDQSGSISENFITALYKDSKNRLWVGTNTAGLNLFDYQTETFIPLSHDKNDANSLSDNRILSISEDAHGAIWVATKRGLNKILIRSNSSLNLQKNIAHRLGVPDPARFKITKIRFDLSGKELFDFRDASDSAAYFHPSCFIDHSGNVIVHTERHYFYIRPSNELQDTITEIKQFVTQPGEEKQVADIYSAIHSVQGWQEMMFVLAMNDIARIVDKSGITTLNGTKENNGPSKISETITRKFIYNYQLYEYNLETKKVTEIHSQSPDKELFLRHSLVIFKGRNDKTWIGTGGFGLVNFGGTPGKFNRVNSSSIHWLYAADTARVLIRDGNLLTSLKQETGYGSWRKDDHYLAKLHSLLKGSFPGSAVQQKDGKLWVDAGGIGLYERDKNILKTIDTRLVPWPAFYVDKSDCLWFASDSTLCTIGSDHVTVLKYPIKLKYAAPEYYVETIFRDAEGIIWLGTTVGLLKFDVEKNQWDQYVFKPGAQKSLSSNLIMSICPDTRANCLWIGTNGGGLNCFNKTNGECKRYLMSDGLPNEVVYGILTDNTGDLWLSTNRGLSNFHVLTQSFENYTVEDGLQGSEYNRHAYCKTSDGIMFFGGVNGYNYFDPIAIRSTPSRLPILITGIYNNGSEIDFTKKEGCLSLPSFLSKKISFQYPDNSLSFEFSGMLFNGSARSRYRYMLEGVDKDWVLSSTNHSAVYANLRPGKYIFKVQNSGILNSPTLIEVLILPPWYLTWWFMLSVSVFALGIVYVFYRYNLQIEINRFRDHQRIASDLHDEIGSTLSSIHIYSEVALGGIESRPLETAGYLRKISNNVENTIGSLDDIVWALNTKGDRFEDVGNRIRASAISIAEACGYTLDLYFGEELNSLRFGKETRKNLFLIYKEAINNVVKYAKGTCIFIHLEQHDNIIELSVRDNGKGFIEKGRQSGNGLGNMRKRAKDLHGTIEIISSPGEGTNVVLRFPYRAGR